MGVTFLFGSGADTDACSCLPSGDAFSEALIIGTYNHEVRELLNIDTSHFKVLYRSSSKMYIQTIYHHQEEARSILGDEIIDACIRYYNGESNVKYDEIKDLFPKWYDAITNPQTEFDKKIKNFFLSNAVLFDALDEKFNSLRYLQPNSNANRAMIAYASVFVLMVKKLYQLPKDFCWSYANIFDKLKDNYDVTLKENSYYNAVKKLQDEYYVVTPNYTNLAEKAINTDVIYLHGNLTWFEDLRKLSVYSCIYERDQIDLSNKIIPFIMIPSGVKPIICSKQLYQFNKFMNALKNSNMLCIIGYKFNSEDNHINSLIAEWLKQETAQIIYFNFQTNSDGGVDVSKLSWLDPSYTVRFLTYDTMYDFEIGNSKITSININGNNSNFAFERFINILNRRFINDTI